ncbi:hypothetical protein FDC35_13385 [Clostridium botulinum]|nr:hypothetical protein [Clostridium botulinum]NFO48541.1 hypothetical protein [Clostridium botulinum]NFP01844.1 hypothetical protein [Clostridium botulinum]
MIGYEELLYSTAEVLKKEFKYEVKIDENKKEIKEPTFFVSVTPLTEDSYLRWNENLVNITIDYVEQVLKQEKMFIIQHKLKEVFNMYLPVGKRKIVLGKKRFSSNDGFITLTLTLNYLDDKSERNIPEEDKATKLMEKLIHKEVM